jgi:hypothetical protein
MTETPSQEKSGPGCKIINKMAIILMRGNNKTLLQKVEPVNLLITDTQCNTLTTSGPSFGSRLETHFSILLTTYFKSRLDMFS